MGVAVALDGDQTGIGHLANLLLRGLVGGAGRVADDKDRGLDVILLQQGEQLRVVVIVAVVKG